MVRLPVCMKTSAGMPGTSCRPPSRRRSSQRQGRRSADGESRRTAGQAARHPQDRHPRRQASEVNARLPSVRLGGRGSRSIISLSRSSRGRDERSSLLEGCGDHFSLSPLFAGRDERSSLLEGWGEGLLPQIPNINAHGEPPHPDCTGRCFASPRQSDLSPQAGRGKSAE